MTHFKRYELCLKRLKIQCISYIVIYFKVLPTRHFVVAAYIFLQTRNILSTHEKKKFPFEFFPSIFLRLARIQMRVIQRLIIVGRYGM